MAFPTSPTNGQQYTENGIIYTYNSTLTAWTVNTNTGANVSAVSMTTSGNAAIGATLTTVNLVVSGNTTLSAGAFSANSITTGGTLSVVGSTTLAGITANAGSFTTLAASSTLNTTGAATFSSTLQSTSIGIGTSPSGTSGQLLATTGVFSSTLQSTSIGIGTSPSGTSGQLVAATGVFSSTVQSTSIGVGTTPSGTSGQLIATNSITAFYSDSRLKTEIGRIENALDKIDQLTGILYTQNKLAESFGYNDYAVQVGLRAQDVKIVQPEVVKIAPFDMRPDGTSKSGEDYLTVQYEKLIPLLIEGIKELRVEINNLKGRK
jgi:hypothetical protein